MRVLRSHWWNHNAVINWTLSKVFYDYVHAGSFYRSVHHFKTKGVVMMLTQVINVSKDSCLPLNQK